LKNIGTGTWNNEVQKASVLERAVEDYEVWFGFSWHTGYHLEDEK